jgi:hypothetical protein
VRGPGLAGFRLDLGETGAWRRIRDADEDIAGRALDLPAGELWFALQRLVAVGTVKFEFVCAHNLRPHHAQNRVEKYIKDFFILFGRRMRM